MSKEYEKKNKVMTFFDLISAPLSYKIIIDLDLIFFTISYILILMMFLIFDLIRFYSIWIIILFTAVSFLLSLVIMKPERFIGKNKFFEGEQKKKKSEEKKRLPIMIFLKKFIVILPRIAFFNILHNFFPIFIIFIASIMFFYISGTLSIANASNFLQAATLIGIILGFFQYYLNRYEEKTQQIIVTKMSAFTGIVVKQASFINFRKFIEKKSKESTMTRNKYSNFQKDILNKAVENPLYKLKDKRLPGKDIIHYQPQFIVGGGEEFLFGLLESEIENDEQEKQLIEFYKEFFEDVKKTTEEKLKKDAGRMEELAKLLFSNINIVGEARISFINAIYDIEKYEEPVNYTEFLIKTNYEIMNEILTKILIG